MLFWVKKARPARRFGITNRKSGIACALTLQFSNHFAFYEIFHDISQPPADFAPLTSVDCCRVGANSHVEAGPERAPRKIQHAAGLYLPAGDFATNDLAVWDLHQLSGQRGCPGEQHRRGRRKRTLDCSGSDRWQQDDNRLEAV